MEKITYSTDGTNEQQKLSGKNPYDLINEQREQLDIILSKDGSLVKLAAASTEINTKEGAKVVAGRKTSQIASNRLVYQQRHRRMDLQDKMDFGPIHRCCQIFNVLVRKFFKYN